MTTRSSRRVLLKTGIQPAGQIAIWHRQLDFSSIAGSVKRSHNPPCLSPPSRPPGAAKEPPTFREARDLLLELERRLSRRARRLLLAAARAVQLGARLVRRRACGGRAWAEEPRSKSSASGSRRGPSPSLLGIVASRQWPARARRQARRPSPDDAGRRSRTVGDDAGLDEARPCPDPGDADAWARPTSPTGSSAARRNIWSRMGPTRRSSRGSPTASSASRSARRRPAGAPTTRFSASEVFHPDGPTKADDPMLLYFTSGTTARSKLVVHTHASYPIGHLSTMYGLGLKPGDAHLNISSPGWAKHAWSSFFAPWNAGATIIALSQRFEPRAALDALVEHRGHRVLRAADRVADADPARSEAMEGRSARGQRGGRAGQSGDHRAGEARLGPVACAIPTGRPRPR